MKPKPLKTRAPSAVTNITMHTVNEFANNAANNFVKNAFILFYFNVNLCCFNICWMNFRHISSFFS